MQKPELHNQQKILQQLVEGDSYAFRKLYEFYQGRIFAFAYLHTKSAVLAKEIVQEVFIKIWEKRELINPDLSFEAYIKVATRNHIINYLRKVKRQQSFFDELLNRIIHNELADTDIMIAKELDRLHQLAIRSLTERQREVYILGKDEELTYAQIADTLGLSKETVKTHMQDALKAVRSYISNHLDFELLLLLMMMQKNNQISSPERFAHLY